ncbi:MAG: septum formation protein Maf [Planctomycetes bacterium]|nr:septum formation protein Maf [Planctomycetota bacterium]
MSGPLLLASTSPRRSELLRSAGVAFEALDPGVDDAAEALVADDARARGLDPAAAVTRVALLKLLAALPRARAGQRVLAADTTVVLDGALLGKAPDRAAAAGMLGRLRGRGHEVLTAVALVGDGGGLRVEVERSEVRFADFGQAALQAYLDSGGWRGKAGAYGVQDEAAAALVAGVSGSWSNVVGLPLERVSAMLGAR